MKIGIDARFFGTPGKGLGRYTEKLVRYLEELDTIHEYEIFLYGESFDSYHPANPNFTKIKVPYRWYGWSEQILYPLFLWKRKLDLVHFPHFNVPFFYRKPFVVTIHDLILLRFPTQKASTRHAFWYRFKYWVYLQVIRGAIQRARKILTVSEFTRLDVENFYPEAKTKMVVTLEGVDQFCFFADALTEKKVREQFWQVAGKNKDRSYVLYVGNSYPHKNLDVFLSLAQAEPDTDIVLVGKKDYFYERFERKIQRENTKNIYLIGSVTDAELAVLYRNAHAYVFPSLYEGFGLPPLEAMQYGLPVLVSNRGSLPEVVGEGALVSDPEERDVFIQDYKRILHDETFRRALREKGVARAATFSWQRMAEATKAIYTGCVSE